MNVTVWLDWEHNLAQSKFDRRHEIELVGAHIVGEEVVDHLTAYLVHNGRKRKIIVPTEGWGIDVSIGAYNQLLEDAAADRADYWRYQHETEESYG